MQMNEISRTPNVEYRISIYSCDIMHIKCD